MLKLLTLIFIGLVSVAASAQVVTCRATSTGVDYKDGVKQCSYICTNGCSKKMLLGPGFEGDFGAFNCFGSIIQIQPSMNGQLSPNAVGFRDFKIKLAGVGKYWSAMRYGDLHSVVANAYQGQLCQKR